MSQKYMAGVFNYTVKPESSERISTLDHYMDYPTKMLYLRGNGDKVSFSALQSEQDPMELTSSELRGVTSLHHITSAPRITHSESVNDAMRSLAGQLFPSQEALQVLARDESLTSFVLYNGGVVLIRKAVSDSKDYPFYFSVGLRRDENAELNRIHGFRGASLISFTSSRFSEGAVPIRNGPAKSVLHALECVNQNPYLGVMLRNRLNEASSS